MPAASACAWMTRRLRIGLGIVNVYGHHPTLIAMEFAALDELAEGRAVLGIGSGIGRLIEQMGFAWQPLASIRDAFHILRGLLAGEEVSHRGRVFSVEKARLGFRPLRAIGGRGLLLQRQIRQLAFSALGQRRNRPPPHQLIPGALGERLVG